MTLYLDSPICLFTIQILWGYDDDRPKGSLQVSKPLLRSFRAKIPRRKLAHNSVFFCEKKGSNSKYRILFRIPAKSTPLLEKKRQLLLIRVRISVHPFV